MFVQRNRHSLSLFFLVTLIASEAWLAGCDPHYASWRFTFTDDTLREQTVVIEATILEGGCDGEELLYEQLLTPLNPGEVPGVLEPGTYGFRGRAGSADCEWIAEGCAERELPIDNEVEIRLRASPIEAYCDEGYCVLGRCYDEELDADLDVETDAEADADEVDADLEVDVEEPLLPPVTPELRLPFNGWTTGSALAPTGDVALDPRRPVFVWTAVENAETYELVVDDSCEIGSYRRCDMPSPAISVVVAETSYQPDDALPIAEVAPMGRRYYWRVRACNEDGCSEWSLARYVDVGRLFNDFNGDGYSDLAVSTVEYEDTFVGEGTVFVFFGGDAGLSTEATRLPNPRPDEGILFGHSVATVGDVNADGFSDLVVGSHHGNFAAIYLGSPEGIELEPTLVDGISDADFGRRVAGAGDMNADGYADIIVGAPSEDESVGASYVFRGSSTGIGGAPWARFGNPTPGGGRHGYYVSGAGDVNGDGYADAVVGAYLNPVGGQAFIYHGGESRPSEPSTTLENPSATAGDGFGIVVATAGDSNGDGFSDVVIGEHLHDETYEDEGAAYVFQGSPSGLLADSVRTLTSPHAELAGNFGWRIASAGDVNRDGYADVLVGATGEDAPVENSGRAYLFHGTESGLSLAPNRIFDNPDDSQLNAGFGLSVANGGDIDGDGFPNIFVGAPLQNEARGRAFLYAADELGFPTTPTMSFAGPDPRLGASFAFSLETGLGP